MTKTWESLQHIKATIDVEIERMTDRQKLEVLKWTKRYCKETVQTIKEESNEL